MIDNLKLAIVFAALLFAAYGLTSLVEELVDEQLAAQEEASIFRAIHQAQR